MAKKYDQSSGSSYSLLALLKRTLFLHETAGIDELVEEVHEHMLRDQPVVQVKQRYVEPILRGNPSFIEIRKGSNEWRLAEGNKVNDSIYEMFQKNREPLSERQVLNRLAKQQQLDKLEVAIDLKNDARFLDIENGKYWILSEWIVINEYARSMLLRIKGPGLLEDELIERVTAEYHVDPDKAIFLPMLDARFVKKEKKWTIQRSAVEQKTKLRPSRMDRLYKYLQKADRPMSAEELTSIVLNMPAATTDVDEKLTADPRFVRVNDLWELRGRAETRMESVTPEPSLEQPPVRVMAEPVPVVPPVEPEIPVPEAELPREPQPSEEILPVPETPAEISPELTPEPQPELPQEPIAPEPDAAEAEALAEPPSISGEMEAALEHPAEPALVAPEEPALANVEERAEHQEVPLTEIPIALPEEKIAEAIPAPEEIREAAERDAEALRKKVIEFLQDAFHSERIVYSADLIHDLSVAEDRVELFEQFSLEHFANPAKNRELTDSDLVKFMVYLAEPTLNDKMIDPCCGTGGFLIQMLATLQTNLETATWREKDLSLEYEFPTGQFYVVHLTPEERRALPVVLDDGAAKRLPIGRFCKQKQLTGMDIEKYAYKTADLNIALHGFPEIVLHQDNALTSKHIGSGLYDVVIGNPPSIQDYPTRFLRRSLTLAKPGGKILLLLPETMLSDFRLVSGSLRSQVVAQTTVKAVIEFPIPYNERAYGPRRYLLYCLKKSLEAEQQTDIFVGRIADFDGLREMIEVLEDPDAPVSDNEAPISMGLLQYILTSYHSSAYTLLVDGLRREALEGGLMSLEVWMQSRRADYDDDVVAEE